MSLARLQEHRRLWRAKPVLPVVYGPWFELLLAQLPSGARVLEVGAGPGLLGAFARERRPDLRWIGSDLHAATWNALAADAMRLPFRTGSVDVVLGLDVLHHLSRPGAFLAEAARVLSNGGRLNLVEPWVTLVSWPVYRFLHHEDCALRVDAWQPFAADLKDSFEGNAAVPWRIVRDTGADHWKRLGLAPPVVRPINAFAYLLSGGFRGGSLLPRSLARQVMGLDRLAAPLARWTGMRALLSWRKAAPPGGEL